MAKKAWKKELEEREGEREGEVIEEKILTYLGLITVIKNLREKNEKLKEELREYVEKKFLGTTPKGYLFWERTIAGVELQDTPLHETDINELISKIGIKEAVKFLIVDRSALVNAIEAKLVNLTLEELQKITRTAYGKKKVIPYYGRRNIQEAVLPKKEVTH